MNKFRNWQSKKEGVWYPRGYWPHRDKPELIQAITFHLADSLAQKQLDRLKIELEALNTTLLEAGRDPGYRRERRSVEKRRQIDSWLDAGYGACILKIPAIAQIVKEVLLNRDGIDYSLIAWCIMPNHVHVVVKPTNDRSIGKIVKAWKSVSARKINSVNTSKGSVWGRDYHDRFIRDEAHWVNEVRYTEENPVKAGLVDCTERWTWSSAYGGVTGEGTSAPKGKILRLKEGYNPNSSSVGSSIPLFLSLSGAAGVVAMLLLNTVDIIKAKKKYGESLESHPKEIKDETDK